MLSKRNIGGFPLIEYVNLAYIELASFKTF